MLPDSESWEFWTQVETGVPIHPPTRGLDRQEEGVLYPSERTETFDSDRVQFRLQTSNNVYVLLVHKVKSPGSPSSYERMNPLPDEKHDKSKN